MRVMTKISIGGLAITLGLIAGIAIGCFMFNTNPATAKNAWRICSSFSGKCAIYPFSEWQRDGKVFYHRKDPSRYLHTSNMFYKITTVKIDAEGKLVD